MIMGSTILTPQILYAAYSQGYFPMPDPTTGEIHWYRPDPRAIIPLNSFHLGKSTKKILRKNNFQVTFSHSFTEVMKSCSRPGETWINEEIIEAYSLLHKVGAAQSVEIWENNHLIAGVYGVNFGAAFFAESMFYRVSNFSKIALYYLVEKLKERNFTLLECQFLTDHLRSLGAVEIPDSEYMKLLQQALKKDTYF